MATKSSDPAAATLLAVECGVHAETKDGLDWTDRPAVDPLARDAGLPLPEEEDVNTANGAARVKQGAVGCRGRLVSPRPAVSPRNSAPRDPCAARP
jgi:hypothetical protein